MVDVLGKQPSLGVGKQLSDPAIPLAGHVDSASAFWLLPKFRGYACEKVL